MKKAYLLLLAGMLSTAVFADNKQTVKIDGQVIEKTISEITFDGDNVVLHFAFLLFYFMITFLPLIIYTPLDKPWREEPTYWP